MLKGVLFILSACFIWGLNFVVPGLLAEFSPFEITLGGFFFLGILSCTLMLGQGIKKWKFHPPGCLDSSSSFCPGCEYSLLFSPRHRIALLKCLCDCPFDGISPITISFYGNWRQKECSNRQLVIPSLLIGSGVVCVNWEAFFSLSWQAGWEYAFGLFCGILSLLAWNWHVVANAHFLKLNPTLSSSDWSSLIGIGTFAWVLLLIPLFFATASSDDLVKYTRFEPELYYFLGGCLVMGFLCSWLAYDFWNIGTQALPIYLTGQLSIFETIFGILFFYLLKGSLPTFLESFGMITTLSGVCFSMYLFRKPLGSPLLLRSLSLPKYLPPDYS